MRHPGHVPYVGTRACLFFRSPRKIKRLSRICLLDSEYTHHFAASVCLIETQTRKGLWTFSKCFWQRPERELNRKIFNTGSCPACGSGRVYVASSPKPYRHFRCKICNKRWKTIEIIVDQPEWLLDLVRESLISGQFSSLRSKIVHLLEVVAASVIPGA